MALADFTDLRCASRAGHSRGTADLARSASVLLRLSAADADAVYRAGLVHDIGLHGVPTTILDKSTPLTGVEQERLRASAYYTERVLARPKALARLGAIAGYVHERMDGTGYHRGVTGTAIPMPGRILAAACMFHELVEPRAGRPALSVKQAAARIRGEASAGRLDQVAADAVLAAAGAGTRRPVAGPAGLTTREIEVLVLIANGLATSDVARQLGISRKTAGTHIERIYTKTGASSRSTATLFALRHGLLDPSLCREFARRHRAGHFLASFSPDFAEVPNMRETVMASKAVVSLTTGMEDPEKVTVAFLVAVGAAETGRETLMFLTKEAVRLAVPGVATGTACEGCPPLTDLVKRYEAAGGKYYVCPICFNTKQLEAENLIAGAELNGTIPLWNWIGDEQATTFSY